MIWNMVWTIDDLDKHCFAVVELQNSVVWLRPSSIKWSNRGRLRPCSPSGLCVLNVSSQDRRTAKKWQSNSQGDSHARPMSHTMSTHVYLTGFSAGERERESQAGRTNQQLGAAPDGLPLASLFLPLYISLSIYLCLFSLHGVDFNYSNRACMPLTKQLNRLWILGCGLSWTFVVRLKALFLFLRSLQL